MPDWKLHTPNGVNDVLPRECAAKKDIEETIRVVFSTFGYKEIESPSFEYYDCYSSETGQISQEKLYKFFDEQGRILALRPDFTTSIARMAATKAAGETLPDNRQCLLRGFYGKHRQAPFRCGKDSLRFSRQSREQQREYEAARLRLPETHNHEYKVRIL